jgi:hypothetical protein
MECQERLGPGVDGLRYMRGGEVFYIEGNKLYEIKRFFIRAMFE